MIGSFCSQYLSKSNYPLLKCGLFVILFALQNSAFAKLLPGENSNASAASTSNNTRNTFNKLPSNLPVDSMAVHKGAHEMLVFNKGTLLKKYRICLGLNPLGPKQYEGDYKTPEGNYYINAKYPTCRYHKGLQISYPNKEDVNRARKSGKSPGGDILIHGLPNGQENVGPNRYRNDWTWGCVGLRNPEIDELFTVVKVGTPIFITK